MAKKMVKKLTGSLPGQLPTLKPPDNGVPSNYAKTKQMSDDAAQPRFEGAGGGGGLRGFPDKF